jgi:hypothetical protein
LSDLHPKTLPLAPLPPLLPVKAVAATVERMEINGMASRFLSIFPQPLNATPSVYAGGKLLFYASGTSQPLDTFSNEGLTIANTNPVILNSAGFPDVAIFLQNRPYKVVLKDSNDITITTVDPYYVTDFKSVAITKVGLGSPAGVVEGTAGSPGVLATQYWDAQNLILYFCSGTGNAATASWTAINASAATPTVVPPQGYLTPTPGTAIITADATSSTSIGYEPLIGNLLPFYNGARHVPTEFSALTLSLHSSHAINTIYDVFGFLNSGVPTLVTGPAWSNSAAGAGSRGTGAGTTELTRLGGYWVNSVSMSARNGTTTYTVGANLATYLGSVFIDGTAGQVTCHRNWGQSRKWGVWNCYNRQPLILLMGDATASWSYTAATIRQSNGSTSNKLTVFCGLAEELIDVTFAQVATPGNTNDTVPQIGVGWNSTTVFSGKRGWIDNGATDFLGFDLSAQYISVPFIGINNVNSLEFGGTTAPGVGSATFFGGNDDMQMLARWRG